MITPHPSSTYSLPGALSSQAAADVPLASAGNSAAVSRTQKVMPRFGFISALASQGGGALGAFSAGVDLLEKPTVELALTDFMGMCVPRSYLEYKKRGWDSARENAIREVTAMMFNVFVAGWVSIGMLKLLGDRVGQFNPIGMNHRAWMDVGALDAFGRDIYKNVLSRPDVTTPEQAERAFIQEALSRLQSTDKNTQRMLLKNSLPEALRQDQNFMRQLEQSLRSDGRLSPDAIARLRDSLEQKLDGTPGHINLIDRALANLQNSAQGNETLAAERLRLSRLLFAKPNEKQFDATMVQAVKRYGLSDRVNLLDAQGNVLLDNRRLGTTLKQMQYFRHEVLNRAHRLPDGNRLSAADSTWKETALRAVYNTQHQHNTFWKRAFPVAEDGLIDYARKSKRLLTILPLGLTIVTAISVAFINNYITRKHHGGRVFSPIEEGLRDKMQPNVHKQGQAGMPSGNNQGGFFG